jgi:hypothetical protein
LAIREGYSQLKLQELVNMAKVRMSYRATAHSAVFQKPPWKTEWAAPTAAQGQANSAKLWGGGAYQGDGGSWPTGASPHRGRPKAVREVHPDKKGVTMRFVDNLPTRRFVTTSLSRHPGFFLTKSKGIKCTKASLYWEEVQSFSTTSRSLLRGHPENMYNTNKKNLRGDPRGKKCLFKRRTKYCNKVQNASKKQCPWCALALDLESECLWWSSTKPWISTPVGASKAMPVLRVDGSACICFNFGLWISFRDWREGQAKSCWLGTTNHISPKVIDLCKAKDIAFVCLPPNSINQLQPLDVEVFGPWRQTGERFLPTSRQGICLWC